MMAENGPVERSLTNYCTGAEGTLKEARVSWRDDPETVCAVDYSARERNPYDDLWGIAFYYTPETETTSDQSRTNGCENSDVSVEVVGGAVEMLDSVREPRIRDEQSFLGRFRHRTDGRLIPARLTWRPGQSHLVCLLTYSDREYHSHENIWAVVFQTKPTDEDRPKTVDMGEDYPTEPYMRIDVGDEMRTLF